MDFEVQFESFFNTFVKFFLHFKIFDTFLNAFTILIFFVCFYTFGTCFLINRRGFRGEENGKFREMIKFGPVITSSKVQLHTSIAHILKADIFFFQCFKFHRNSRAFLTRGLIMIANISTGRNCLFINIYAFYCKHFKF